MMGSLASLSGNVLLVVKYRYAFLQFTDAFRESVVAWRGRGPPADTHP